jgi:hypothetical protein
MSDLVLTNPPGPLYPWRKREQVTKDDVRAIVAEEIAKALKSAPSGESDRMVDIKEASKLSGMSVDYLYHNAARPQVSRGRSRMHFAPSIRLESNE